MTRAPHITNDTLSRRLYRLRTNHHTLIKLSMWKKLMTSRKYRASRPHVGKADPALSLTGTCNGSVRSYPRQAHSPNPHNNKRPTKPNPAISRLSASPTPGNVPRHSNGAHVASEKPTPNRTLAAISNAAVRPVIAVIRAQRSILSAQTSVC